jgi:pimeloyl-ACP methyl ester carboxylesterase
MNRAPQSNADTWLPRRFLRAALTTTAVLATWVGHTALRTRAAELEHLPVGEFLEIDGVRLHYVERGAGPALVLLHGNGAMIEDFAISGILERLAQRYRVIAIDRPGFGHTTRPRPRIWTAPAQAALMHAALARLEVARAIVVGHSWGTLAALSLALDHPADVRSLVLLAGYYFPTVRADVIAFSIPATPVIGDLLDWTVMPIVGSALRGVVFRKLFAPAAVSPRFSAEFPTALALRPSQIRASAIDTELMTVSAGAIAGRYAELAIPVVIMAGKHDRIVDFERQSRRLASALPNARLIAFDEVGHMIHHTIPAKVVEAVDLAEADSAAKADNSRSRQTPSSGSAGSDPEPIMIRSER